MFKKISFLHLLYLIALLLVFSLQGGCSYYDCGYTYHVQGKVVDSTEKPMANVKVNTASITYDTAEYVANKDWPGFSYTDSTGNYHDTFGTGIAWGYQKLFGFIHLGPKEPPLPPQLEYVVLYVEKSDESWHVQRIPLVTSQQTRVAPGERWIELNTISISE